MPKKPKINNRLNKLFLNLQPEDNPTRIKEEKTVEGEKVETAAAPVAPAATAVPSAPLPPAEPALAEAESVPVVETLDVPPAAREPKTQRVAEILATSSSYSVNIQTGYSEWSTLRIFDDNKDFCGKQEFTC